MTEFASCCVLSYERPHFLRDLLVSMAHSGPPLELIVHDDGSQDRALLTYLGELHAGGALGSLILNQPGWNRGQGVALNRMFRLASGDPIVKLDQDLILHPGWLQRVQYLLATNADAAAKGTEPRIGLLGLFHYHHEPVDSAKTKLEQFVGWSSRTHIIGSGFAVTRECWEALGPFEEGSEAFAEDWDFQQRVTASQDFVCALPDEDLCTNQGFGVGPSTIVVAPDTVRPIHHGPFVLGAQE